MTASPSIKGDINIQARPKRAYEQKMAMTREDQEREGEGSSAPDLADSISPQTASATMLQMPPAAAIVTAMTASVFGGINRVSNRSPAYPFHGIL